MKKPQKKDFKRYMLVDGHALIHRAFHAIAHLSTKSGEQTNAVYGFTVILLNAIKDIKPTHVALTFDLPKPTFRHEKYEDYKATRVKTADELTRQVPRVKEVVRALGVPIFEKESFEADDLLGTLACEIKKENGAHDGYEIIIVTGDLDTLQLVDDHVKIYIARKGLSDTMVYDVNAVHHRYGIEPSQIVDFKAIKGDPSDNIPGINGIGEKGALDLIKKYGDVKNIYKHLDELKDKTRKLFAEQKEQLEMSRWLSKIVCDVPIDFNLPPYVFGEEFYRETVRLFQNLEFKSLIAKLPKVYKVDDAGNTLEEHVAEGHASELSDGSDARTAAASLQKKQKYYLVDTLEKLEKLHSELEGLEEFAFDTETSGLDPLQADLVGIGVSFKEGEAYYVPAQLLSETMFSGLHKVFSDKSIKKIAHNIKFDFLALKKFGIHLENFYFDTMIASYLLSPGSRAHDLDTLVFNEFGYTMQPIEDLIGKGKNQISIGEVNVEKIAFYCGEDVDFTYRLKNLLEPRLRTEGFANIFTRIEMPLTKVLAEMEENGIWLDLGIFKRLDKEAAKELTELEKKIYKLAGEEFNINSPTQLKVILFDKLKIPVKGVGAEGGNIKKTKTGYSTAASELEKMRGEHKIIDYISQYRELSKLQSTYIQALPTLVNRNDHRLHTSFNQTIAATGRLSSSNPNLQNIPAASTGIPREIRRGFIAAPGNKLLSIDYSQIELRVVAHLAEDPTMIEIFKNGQDIHTGTAMQVFGVKDPKKVTPEQRRDAKMINFGILYGLSAFGLSERLPDISRSDAAAFIEQYFKVFPRIKKYLDDIVEFAHKNGYVANELGRKRYMPEINSSQFMVRNGAERAATNMPIQSLEADIVKMAMNDIAREINIQSPEIKMLLQIHDSLVFEVREDLVDDYAKRIKKIMESAYTLRVPITADVKVGQSWGDLE